MEKIDKFISVHQASKKLDVSTETVYNMCKDGRLGGRYSKGLNKKKGMWLISLESIILYLERTSFPSLFQEETKQTEALTLF